MCTTQPICFCRVRCAAVSARAAKTATHLVVDHHALDSPALRGQPLSSNDHGGSREHVARVNGGPPVRGLQWANEKAVKSFTTSVSKIINLFNAIFNLSTAKYMETSQWSRSTEISGIFHGLGLL